MGAQWYDGLIAIPGCDKNMPGVVMGMARLNRPAIMVYGGTIRAGKQPSTGESLDIVSAFQSYGAYVYDKIERKNGPRSRAIVPGPRRLCGACIRPIPWLPRSKRWACLCLIPRRLPRIPKEKRDECARAGEAIKKRPGARSETAGHHDQGAFENAIRMVMVTGGSTNAVLHPDRDVARVSRSSRKDRPG